MIQLHNILVDGSKDRPMLADVYFKSDQKKKPIIIFVHGFKGFKDWGHFNMIGKSLANAGFIFYKFNFSYNGSGLKAPSDFTDLEAFGQNNFSIELDDLGKMIDFSLNNSIVPKIESDLQKVYLIGHSRGGGIAILKTAEDSRITKLVTWASVAEFGRYWSKEVMQRWKDNGVMSIRNGRTNQDMPLYFQLYENYFENLERLNIPRNAASINNPWLIVHGTNDEAVPIEAAKELHSLNDDSKLRIVVNGNHTFGGRHPWNLQTLSEDMDQVLKDTIHFFNGNNQ